MISRNLQCLGCASTGRNARSVHQCAGGKTPCVQPSGPSPLWSASSWPWPCSPPRAAATVRQPRLASSGGGPARRLPAPTSITRRRPARSTARARPSRRRSTTRRIAELPDTAPEPHRELRRRRFRHGQDRSSGQPGRLQCAGTDSTVKPEDLPTFKGGPILYFPTVAAPITVSYNLSGVDELQLSADTLAKIFQADDHDLERPGHRGRQPRRHPAEHADRRRAPRSDGSGTTSNFTKYLDGRRPRRPGRSAPVTRSNWPANTQAGQRQHRRGPDRQGHRRCDRLRRLLRRQRGRT